MRSKMTMTTMRKEIGDEMSDNQEPKPIAPRLERKRKENKNDRNR